MADPTPAERIAAEPVAIFVGNLGYEVHVDAGLFTVVDAGLLREWGPLSLQEVSALHAVIAAALADPEGTT